LATRASDGESVIEAGRADGGPSQTERAWDPQPRCRPVGAVSL